MTPRPDSLFTRFLLVGALAIAVFSAAMATLLTSQLRQSLLQADAALTREFVQSVVDAHGVEPALRAGDLRSGATLSDFLDQLRRKPELLHLAVYGADRRVLWSTRSELIGQLHPHNDELDAVLLGQPMVHLTADPSQPFKQEQQLTGSDREPMIETYVPVRGADGRVVAAVETYRRPERLFDELRRGRERIWIGSALGGVFLFLSLVGFVRWAERLLQAQQRQLVETGALALAGELAAAVAHSIRNPLGSIRSTAELQAALGGDPDGQHAQVVRDADRIDALLRTLLTQVAAALGPPGLRARADLGATLAPLLQRWQADLSPDGPRSRRLEVDLGDRLGHVPLAPDIIEQLLASLLTNAVEATPAGGPIRVQARRQGAEAVITVSDQGRGLEPGQRERLFTPLHTTKAGGLGMGLVLVRRAVERAGGQVRIDTNGPGVRVELRLPAGLPGSPGSTSRGM